MKIVVTGATGFLGRHVIAYLKTVADIDIYTSGIEELDVEKFPWLQGTTYIPCNLHTEKENWFDFFHQPDKLIHLAWKGLPNYKGMFHLSENLFNDYRFLQNMIVHGLADLSISGTCFEYGMQEGELSELSNTFPDNPYALAKDTLRKMLQQLQKHHQFQLKWIRLFYMYGKGQSPNSILSQLDKAIEDKALVFNMSGGEQTRDYLPAELVAKNIVRVSLQNEVVGIINNCSGKGIKVIDLVKKYLESKSVDMQLNLGYYPYPDYEPFAFWGNCEKLNLILKNNE